VSNFINSAVVMTKLATMPVPQEQREVHMQNGTTLLNLAHGSIESGNYSQILDRINQIMKSSDQSFVIDQMEKAKAIVDEGLKEISRV